MHYSYGELLYGRKRFAEAYDHYLAVYRLAPTHRHAQFCVESAIFAADQLIKAARPPRTTVRRDLSAEEAQALTALDLYASAWPTSPKARGVTYKAGYLLYGAGQFPEAAERFRAVIAADPKSREAEMAANLILDSLNLTQDWVRLRDEAGAYAEHPDLGDAAFKPELRTVHEKAAWKVAETTAGDAAAATAWLDFQARFPRSQDAPKALSNAAACYDRLGREKAAADVRKRLATEYPEQR